MDTFKGKVAVVSGASKGIGRATAECPAQDGASMVVNYAKSAREAKAVVDTIEIRGGTPKSEKGTITQFQQAFLRSFFGGTKYDIGQVSP
jgi:3-oxoacyl-[acyl-carrier protein] reductase